MPHDKLKSELPTTIRVLPDGQPVPLNAQQARLCRQLEERRNCGLTALDALFDIGIGRAQARIAELRQFGIEIETTRERTARGASIGRYWLRSQIEIVGGGGNERN